MNDEAEADLARDIDQAGLVHVTDETPGIRRRRAGKGFSYRDDSGTLIRDGEVLKRIRSLAVPPAWREVWICMDPAGHLQASGRDDRGRKQYRYHPRWRSVRDESKFHRLLDFARALPRIRRRVAADLRLPGLQREKVLAAIVRLLETTLIRVGNLDYEKENRSHGLTTLKRRHVSARADHLRFRFKGKSGKEWNLQVDDRRVAKVVRSCQDLPGQHLFRYRDESGDYREVTSTDVNDYLREISGGPFTAKDFRTWAGTVAALAALSRAEVAGSAAQAKRTVRATVVEIAAQLRNTPTICRQCYIHPTVVDCYMAGSLQEDLEAARRGPADAPKGLRVVETEAFTLLRFRSGR